MLEKLTQAAVLRALKEFDTLEREEFLKKYKFGKSRGYFLIYQGKAYDSKAIAGVALQYIGQEGAVLKASEFSGGDQTVARILRKLEFVVREPSDAAREEIPFEIGKTYHRQRDIHQRFSGQERGGISTPKGVNFIFLFTGESGVQYGYSDGPQPNGVFAYTGEGQLNHMEFTKGNRAIRDHVQDGKDLLLFEALSKKGFYRFLGSFGFAGWETRAAPDRTGAERNAIVFHLIKIENANTTEPDGESLEPKTSTPLSDLRNDAYSAATAPKKPPTDARRDYFYRSAKVKEYVLRRANGRCEACSAKAPFMKKNGGEPYLEPHHIKRIADGGPDQPNWVGAVCPTCHRNIHHGIDGAELNNKLFEYVTKIEDELSSQVK